jgi:4-diphosphocytidyl-2-C-methyl-D-erythritol kinase
MIHIEPSTAGVRVLAPAKLNLFLEVKGKRPDGYHELDTLMVALDWFDTLTLEEDDSGSITLECDDPSLPSGPENLVVRAALALRSATGIRSGARMRLQKTIPAEAGLAGGSSDAAATLIGLDRLWHLDLPRERLAALAATIGSDVPFFTHCLPAARCVGRGEQVSSLAMPHPLHFIVLCPDRGIRTADAYRRVVIPQSPRPIEPVVHALESGDTAALGKALHNRLQPAAESLVPSLTRVRDALKTLDSELFGSAMSGSGSAYFGLARDRASAEHAVSTLSGLGLGRVRATTCGSRDHLA